MLRKVGRILLGIILSLAILYITLVIVTKPADDYSFFDPDRVLVMAHQGGKGLWPDNTLYAFERAVDLGVDVLEMDIHSSADDVLVVMHDDTVDNTTNGSGPIRHLTLAELQSLDAGYNWNGEGETFPFRGQGITVPAVEELLKEFPGVRMNIEIKQTEPSIVKQLCELIHEYGREDLTLVASFDSDTIKDFRDECPGVPTSASESETRLFFILNTAYLSAANRPSAEAFQVPEYSGDLHVLTDRFLESAGRHNMDVHVWTVNDEDDLRRMIDLGVNGIITDYPDRLLDLLER
jgi:glycerophosphoryl diester phosphodiesterase